MNIGVILAAGKGTRMGKELPKQYLLLNGKPILSYSLDLFEKSQAIDKYLIVAGKGEASYIKENILYGEKYGKLIAIIEGGKERHDSVYAALKIILEKKGNTDDAVFVFIHDAARPYADEELLNRLDIAVRESGAAVAGVSVKDTVKVVKNGVIETTPERANLFAAQTPQCFLFKEIYNAYNKMYASEMEIKITDDSQVMELFGSLKCRLIEGNYKNIKITTEEDLKD